MRYQHQSGRTRFGRSGHIGPCRNYIFEIKDKSLEIRLLRRRAPTQTSPQHFARLISNCVESRVPFYTKAHQAHRDAHFAQNVVVALVCHDGMQYVKMRRTKSWRRSRWGFRFPYQLYGNPPFADLPFTDLPPPATFAFLSAIGFNSSMGSRKPSAKAKRLDEFRSQLGGMDDLFAREQRREVEDTAKRNAAVRKKACTSKQRYASYDEAQQAVAACSDYGTTGLSAYRCPHCNGWHLTSHPWK